MVVAVAAVIVAAALEQAVEQEQVAVQALLFVVALALEQVADFPVF